jgi:hypothetical protein
MALARKKLIKRLNTQPTTLRQGNLNGEEKNAWQPIQIMEWLGLK